jgi:hypothetical protein
MESDSPRLLPEVGEVDVVVVGNKWRYTTDDIMSRINGKVINITFS